MAWKITVPNFPAEIKACFGKIVDLSK